MRTRYYILLISLLVLCTSSMGYSATLDIQNGFLYGADDVIVKEVKYNVSFLDQKVVSIGTASQFTFQTPQEAIAASQALLDQVFIGQFDIVPSLTNGIEPIDEDDFANIFTPYGVYDGVQSALTNIWGAKNAILDTEDQVHFGGGTIQADDSLAFAPTGVWAVWQVQAPSPVPLPAAVWIFGSGLIGLAGLKKRRNA